MNPGHPFGIALVALAAAAAAPAAQDQRTTFRSSIDLVRVDVNVLDRDGRPVEGLAAGDFALSVDGQPRKVVTAEYVAASRGSGAAAAPGAEYYSTNAHASGGRLIMFVVDQGTIDAGRARQTTSAAEKFVATLSPADRVALLGVPGMEHLDFTANHGLIRSQLQRMVGLAPPAWTVRQIGVAEALEINRGSPRAIDMAVSRECSGLLRDFERRMCRQEVLSNAAALYAETRDRARTMLGSLHSLLNRLATMPEPKTIILISGGLILDQDYAQVAWFGPLAARAQATVYSIFILAPHFEASLQRLPVQYREDMAVAEEGLNHVADLGRGSMFRLTTDPAPVFDRLALELSGYYLLGFEADAADRDERPHRIRVEVPTRRNLEVRARPEFSASAPRTLTVEELLAETVKAPLVSSEIRLKATTYTFREGAGDKLRVVIGAEIDRARETAGRLALGFGMFDVDGRLVASRVEPDVSTRINPRTGAHQYFTSVVADAPGTYTLKVAVVDDLRRRGSVEHTFRAQLTPAGAFKTGELLLAETGADSGGEAEPVVSADYTSGTIHTLLELYGGSPDDFNGTSVTFELAEREDSRPIESVRGLVVPSAPGATARAIQASIPIGLLPPGDYVARAVVTSGGQTVGMASRPFRVARAVVTDARAGRAPLILPARLDKFDRQAVLSPDVVGFFLDRMKARQARASGAALDHARNGRFDVLLGAAAPGENDALASAFLAGLALYARGDLVAAMGQFREALKADSEFFPAAFYLGACYAAGGRNREAAHAWQTSLVTESDAPFVYPLIADAMHRDRNPAGAAAILREAAERWPSNETLQVRLGVAYASAGKPADAIRTLDPYLTRHPGEHETIFVVLRAIYEARNAGIAIETPERDRETFARFAKMYASAGGTQQPLVDRWAKFLAK
jgi:VWFA-related protein